MKKGCVVSLPLYKVPERPRDGVKREVEKLLKEGIIEESTSHWSSPVVPVLKLSGDIRLCVDFRKLNDITVQEHCYIPDLEDILSKVSDSMVLSKLDLTQGFHQIRVEPQSKNLTTFVCPYGRYRFNRMPFGLKNAPATFQRAMEQVLHPCGGFAACYIDDVVVFSKTWDEHLGHLTSVLQTLRGAGITARPGKCSFGFRYLEYLGHIIGDGKIAVPRQRVTAIQTYKMPRTKSDMHSFLGLIGYYRCFIPGFAQYSALLTPAVAKQAPGEVTWTAEMVDTFVTLCGKLCDVCVLTIPTMSDQFQLQTDASGLGFGGVLNVVRDGKEMPVAFYIRQLRGAEKRYSATELEVLAVVAAIHHFLPYLFGRHFSVVTDHQALKALITTTPLNRHLQDWALKLQNFDFSVLYKAGKENGMRTGYLARRGSQTYTKM